MTEYAFAKDLLARRRARHAEMRAAALALKQHANLGNPALVHELKRLEIDAGYAELELKEAKAALESAL
jgi:hypothetical protein